tara:strand:- start:551 stop:757 length:207 start_codon:yes stop_codon:yes gene_type:complete
MADTDTKNDETELDPNEIIECVVTKLGDGKISSGKHVASVGDVKYKRGKKFKVARHIAESLADKGFVA